MLQPTKSALGLAVRARRVECGLRQDELGLASGLHRTYIGSIERGERNVSWNNLMRLADALDMSMSDLVRLAEEKTRDGTS